MSRGTCSLVSSQAVLAVGVRREIPYFLAGRCRPLAFSVATILHRTSFSYFQIWMRNSDGFIGMPHGITRGISVHCRFQNDSPMPNRLYRTLLVSFVTGVAATVAHAKPLCTVVADAATGHLFVRQGDCATRVTPASTYKIAISLMGFDSGFLQNEHAPTLPYRNGYPIWGGTEWREPTDPARWIKLSVFWFSQQVAQALGQARFQQYTTAFGYGNADVTSTQGRLNGTKGAWTNSSLRISPLEQVEFLRKVVNRTLPVSTHAYDMTEHITELDAQSDGWTVHGKTGTGSPGPRYDPAQAYGWFVGWATKGSRTLVFANLIQDEQRESPNAGVRSRDIFLKELPEFAATTQHKAQ